MKVEIKVDPERMSQAKASLAKSIDKMKTSIAGTCAPALRATITCSNVRDVA